MGISYRIIAFEDVRPIAGAIKKEGVTLANPPGAIWLGAWDGAQLVGVVCMVANKAGTARFKSDFVLQSHRRRGIYAHLFRGRLKLAQQVGAKTATAFCGPMSLPTYLRHGFLPVSTNPKNGVVFVKKEL